MLEMLTPMLETHDFKGTIEFYTQTLGFSIANIAENISWVHLKRDRVEIMFCAPNQHRKLPESIMSGTLYIYTNDVEGDWAKLKDACKICYPIENFAYNMREFGIYDNNGYILNFGQDIPG